MWCWTVIFGADTSNTKLILHLLLDMVVGVTWTRGNYTQSARTLSKIFNQERSKAWRNRWFCLQNIPPGSALVASWWSDAARCRNMKMQLSNQFWDGRKYSIIENAIIQSIVRWEKKPNNWNVAPWFSLQETRTEDIQNRVFELSCSWASSAMLQPPACQRSAAVHLDSLWKPCSSTLIVKQCRAFSMML